MRLGRAIPNSALASLVNPPDTSFAFCTCDSAWDGTRLGVRRQYACEVATLHGVGILSVVLNTHTRSKVILVAAKEAREKNICSLTRLGGGSEVRFTVSHTQQKGVA